MKALIAKLILVAIMSMQMGTKSDRNPRPYTFKTEKCVAVSETMFMSHDGNLFEINNNNLETGESYWVLFDTFNTKTRTDDEIVDFDKELYYKWIKFIY